MGIFAGEDWKAENVGVGLTWIQPELGDCGCFTCSCLQTPQSVKLTENRNYKGSTPISHYMEEWKKVEDSFFTFMDQQPVVTCCFGQCEDSVDRTAAVEALNRDWIPKANQQIAGSNVELDVFLWKYTGGGSEIRMVHDIIVRFLDK